MSAHNILQQMLQADPGSRDPGASGTLTIERQFHLFKITTAGAEARTLAQPTQPGAFAIVALDVKGGNLTLTVTGGYDQAANTSLTFDTAGDWVLFYSVEVGTSCYWRVVRAEGVPEAIGIDLGIHSLTALGAAPALDDMLAVSDESASGDPTRSVTVAELFTAAGDATDLAAAPALDDRLLVTDESATGDPAKSMSVQNLLDARATAVNAAGVGAKAGATVAAAETGVPGHLMKTVLTCTATSITIGDEAGQGQFGGVKVYDFPAGLILFLGAVVDGALTAGVTGTIINDWDGDVGLGTVPVTDHQDATGKCGSVMQKNEVSAGTTDKIGVVKAKSLATALTESGCRHLDGTSSAADLCLNFLIDDDVSHTAGTATFTGTITFWWINLGGLT